VSGDSATIVIMGVAGCGKSTVGAALARYLGVAFVEGDSLHPPENIAKMELGEGLDDNDRWPWLDAVAPELARPGLKVASCSALTRGYREYLRSAAGGASICFAHLDVSPAELQRRVESRQGHFLPSGLLAGQLAILERPDMRDANAQRFDGKQTVNVLVTEIAGWVGKLEAWRK
jgi:gluconokinase